MESGNKKQQTDVKNWKQQTVISARKKEKNSSLSFGQEALTFCWTEATTCSSYLMILV